MSHQDVISNLFYLGIGAGVCAAVCFSIMMVSHRDKQPRGWQMHTPFEYAVTNLFLLSVLALIVSLAVMLEIGL